MTFTDLEHCLLSEEQIQYSANTVVFLLAQWLEHCVSSAKVMGSIPREPHILTKKCIA